MLEQMIQYLLPNPEKQSIIENIPTCKAMKQKSLYKVNGCPDGSKISI